MDLLDISLGAASISNADSNNDPWSISSPHNESAHAGVAGAWPSATNGGAIAKQPMPPIGGNADSWLPSAHSSSGVSDSSNDAWMQKSGASNGNLVGNVAEGAAAIDPWLSKGIKQAVVPDPWLNNIPNSDNDAWRPASQTNNPGGASGVGDPWAPVGAQIGVCITVIQTFNQPIDAINYCFFQARPSPIGAQTSPISDYDEFDVISNRTKTQDNSSTSNNNNNISKRQYLIRNQNTASNTFLSLQRP